MQYRASVPNDRNLNCDKECAKVKGRWREINIYQNLASIVLIPGVIVAFWRGSWDLLDHYEHFFQPGPTLLVSALVISFLELSRSFISKHLKILDDDTRLAVLKKNILLSVYDVIYNLSNVALWWILWGHPEGEFEHSMSTQWFRKNKTRQHRPAACNFDFFPQSQDQLFLISERNILRRYVSPRFIRVCLSKVNKHKQRNHHIKTHQRLKL